MTRRPIANIRVLRLPDLAEGAIRIEVECSGSTTGLTSVPGPSWALTVPQLITNAVYAHEERCDAGCDTSEAHERGDRSLREEVEAAHAFILVAAGRRYAESRRN
jgi:hypothetical protein